MPDRGVRRTEALCPVQNRLDLRSLRGEEASAKVGLQDDLRFLAVTNRADVSSQEVTVECGDAEQGFSRSLAA